MRDANVFDIFLFILAKHKRKHQANVTQSAEPTQRVNIDRETAVASTGRTSLVLYNLYNTLHEHETHATCCPRRYSARVCLYI